MNYKRYNLWVLEDQLPKMPGVVVKKHLMGNYRVILGNNKVVIDFVFETKGYDDYFLYV